MENSTASLISLLAQPTPMNADIRIGAMVALVELEEAPDGCTIIHSSTSRHIYQLCCFLLGADYLREFHEVAQSDEKGEEFQCRFMDSLHRLVKHRKCVKFVPKLFNNTCVSSHITRHYQARSHSNNRTVPYGGKGYYHYKVIQYMHKGTGCSDSQCR